MRSIVKHVLRALVVVVGSAGLATAQNQPTETLLYDHIHLAVPEPDAAVRWYRDHLGGEPIDGREDRLLFGTTRIMWFAAQGRKPSAGGVVDHLGFSVPDLEAKVRELEAAGAKVTTAPREAPGLFKLAFLEDPWGLRLELVEDPQHLGLHHLHLRTPDVEGTRQWYLSKFGGVPLRMRGRLEGILYPGNVWLLFTRGEAVPSRETVIDHFGWRAPTLDPTMAELARKGVPAATESRDMTLPNGQIRFAYINGPDGAYIELVQRAPDMR